MKKRTTIIGTLLISTVVILLFFVSVVLALWFNHNYVTKNLSYENSSLAEFFLNISTIELVAIFAAATIMSAVVFHYISSNIKSSFEKFSQHFYDAAHNGVLIETENLNFKEFAILAESVNYMISRADEAKKRIEFNEKYLQTVLDAQKNMVIVKSHGKLERVNQAFFRFMKVDTLTEFKAKHECISDFFLEVEDDEYLSKIKNDITWVRYILKNPLKNHKVKMQENGKDIIFEVDAKVTEVEDNYKVVITFHNISELEEQKKAFEVASTIDTLTRVSNRLKFDMILSQQIEMSKRYSHSFSLIMFDIDNFKKINDTYGHKVGDNILVELAFIVKNAMRKSDTFARWGGEEFAVILPQLRVKTAVKIAEKFRLKIENNVFEDDLKITCSFGVCEYKKAYDAVTLIECTDKKLYEAKHSGKNRVCS
jgi:diguanylate cyclase (GGDEF)-like protein